MGWIHSRSKTKIELPQSLPPERPTTERTMDVGRATVTVIFDSGDVLDITFYGNWQDFPGTHYVPAQPLPTYAKDLAHKFLQATSPIYLPSTDEYLPRHRVSSYRLTLDAYVAAANVYRETERTQRF